MQRLRALGLFAAFVGTFVLGGFILAGDGERASPRLFQEVFTLVSSRYVDSLEVSSVYEKAARGLLTELDDPYAALYSPEEMEEFTVAHEGHYAGVGMLVEDQRGVARVSRVFPDTPAERAGAREGDGIVEVDGESTRGWPLERVTARLKGEEGTVVAVRFSRLGAGAVDVEMTRAVIRIPAVPFATVLDNDIGYVPLLQFNETASTEVEASVRRLLDEGVRSLILDLRGNGGGLVNHAIEIAGLFLPKGTPVAVQWERAGGEQTYTSPRPPLAPELPLVVLVDEASASASEIVAGALQDHDRAVVLGAATFGKGLVQSAFQLDGDYILKLTTGRWHTPAGRIIHRDRSLVDGRLLEEEAPEPRDTSVADRPVIHSSGGRALYGGGGIVPDVFVFPDTLDEAEKTFVRAVLSNSRDFYLTVYDYAFELKDEVSVDFEVSQAWRDELYRRLLEQDVELERETYDAAQAYIDRNLGDRIARFAFGDEVALRRSLGHDAQLRRALDLLHDGLSQSELLTRVARREGHS